MLKTSAFQYTPTELWIRRLTSPLRTLPMLPYSKSPLGSASVACGSCQYSELGLVFGSRQRLLEHYNERCRIVVLIRFNPPQMWTHSNRTLGDQRVEVRGLTVQVIPGLNFFLLK